MLTLRYAIALLFVLASAPAYAQAPLTPGQQVAIDLNLGRMQSGTTSVPRPEANVAFEFRTNGAATPVPAVKARPCTVNTTTQDATCYLVPPLLAEGTHGLEVRALPSPAEAGQGPTAYSPTLSVAMILVVGPSRPTNPRLVTP